MGQHETAARLVEAFRLDNQFGKVDEIDEIDADITDLDGIDLAKSARELEHFIPASASLPELEDEQSVVADTGVFRIRKRR